MKVNNSVTTSLTNPIQKDPLIYSSHLLTFAGLQLARPNQAISVSDQMAHPLSEGGKPFILRLSPFPTGIDLLQDHRIFEIGEGHVKVQGREVTAALLGISLR
jgi:hypothetical protein